MPKEKQTASFCPSTLIRVAWPLVLGALVVILTSMLSIQILISVRSFSLGEGVWTRNHKDASFQLLRYLHTGHSDALARHDAAMLIQQHLSNAREMMRRDEAQERIVAELLKTRSMQKDFENAVWMNHYFGRLPVFARLFRLWAEGDQILQRLTPLRDELTNYYRVGEKQPERLLTIVAQIDAIDTQLDALAQDFNQILIDTGYRIYIFLFILEVVLGLLFIAAVVWRTQCFLREQKRADQALSAADITLAAVGEAVLSTDTQGRLTYMNKAANQLCRYTLKRGEKTPPRLDNVIQLVDETKNPPSPFLLDELLDGRFDALQSQSDQLLVRQDGTEVPVSWLASPIQGKDGIQGVVLVLHDFSREKELIERLSWLASHDPLTLLFNRREFEERLQDILDARAGKEGGVPGPYALMFIDLDQFKVINDTCGHAAGDELLCQLTRHMSQYLRGQEAFLARMGGDEFGLIFACPPELAWQKAEEMRQFIRGLELSWGLRHFSTTASIGLVLLDRAPESAGMVLSAADLACYKAKDNGRDRVEVYDPHDVELATRFGEMHWAQKVQQALDDGRFCLCAQAITPLQTPGGDEPVAHYELLLRLRDESGALVNPSVFIPAAERYGLMPMVDRWVVGTAFEYIAGWLATDPIVAQTVFAINLSGASFCSRGFLTELKSLFQAHAVPYRQVCFEITETQAVTNLKQAVAFIQEMRALGCAFALDDFGAGMSSFTYLKHIPVDYLKIDGALVRDMASESINCAMVEMISRLGHAMNIKTVGEYAETPEILQALREAGVDYAQGFAIGEPCLLNSL